MKYDFELSLDDTTSLGKIIKEIDNNSKVLEFGPGNGRMTKHLKEHKNCKVSIIELDPELYESASKFADEGFLGNIEDFEWLKFYKNQQFDYIIFADVLEHLREPGKVLKSARKLLKSKGEILISFPNIAHNAVVINLFNNKFEYDKYGILDETHVKFYDIDGFKKLFEEAHLNILKIDYTFAEVGNCFINDSYNDLPIGTQYYFKNRPYGEVFQYIFILTKEVVVEIEEKPLLNSNLHKEIWVTFSNDKEKRQKFEVRFIPGIYSEIKMDLPESAELIEIAFENEPCIIDFKINNEKNFTNIDLTNAYFLNNKFYFKDGNPFIRIQRKFLDKEKLSISFKYIYIGEFPEYFKDYIANREEMLLRKKVYVDKINDKLKEETEELSKIQNEYTKLINSKIWRLTSPVRKTIDIIKENQRDISKSSRKSKGKDKINYTIEKILKDDNTHITQIQGWAYEIATQEPVDFYLVGQDSEGVSIKRDYRIDVNASFHLKDKKYGFFIELNEKFWNQKIILSLKGRENTVKVPLRLTKTYNRLEEMKLQESLKKTATAFNITKNYLKKHDKKEVVLRTTNFLKKEGLRGTIRRFRGVLNKNAVDDFTAWSNLGEKYQQWIKINENYNIKKIKKEIETFEYTPKISLVMPVYNVEKKWLVDCIKSIQEQYYTNWELCIADDASTEKYIKPLLEKYEFEDERIRVIYRKENGHISEASNSALNIATGEFVGLIDNDDLLAPNALFEVVKLLNENKKYDLIYSDEDKITEEGIRVHPCFKSDWAPDMLMSTNYICHFGVYRKSIIDQIGGFRKGYEGAQDYDLVLRFTEKTDKIGHISKILYHWRMIQESTAVNPDSKGYAFEAGKKALEDALERRNLKGAVKHGGLPGIYNVTYAVKDEKLVSVIIPTRDNADDLKACIQSIFEKTRYPNFEVIIADNGSIMEETFNVFDEYLKKYSGRFKIVHIDIPFNFSQINNMAVKEAKGDYLLFLNNDITVITEGWLTKMVGYAQLEHVGAVGAKLLYPDDTVQHAGVLIGMGGVAGHGHCGFPKDDYGYFGRLVLNTNYSAVTAACMLVKRSDFESVNGFEEDLIVAFNDVDFCLKLLEKGKYNVWLNEVQLYHYESKSRGAENTFEKQNRFNNEIKYMKTKWLKYIKHDPYYNENLTRSGGNYILRG